MTSASLSVDGRRLQASKAYPVLMHFIGGEWTLGEGHETLAVHDPATEAVIAHCPLVSVADIARASNAADTAFQPWADLPAIARSRLLRAAADILRERAETIAPLMTLEQGKPLAEALVELRGSADFIDWLAEEGRRTYGTVVPSQNPAIRQINYREPVGPVATFTPWNFPVNALVRKLGAALAAGCTVVANGNKETPASLVELVRCFIDADFPAGSVNLIFGDSQMVSEHLIADPRIRKISLTGSTAVGKKLAALCGMHMKRATMELGGHAPVIITSDCDLSAAVKNLSFQKFRNAGQICISPTRFMVEETIYAEFLDRFSAEAKALRVGDGFDPDTNVGPLAHSGRPVELQELVDDAVAQGARLVTGGGRPFNIGYFFTPTVLADVPITARIMNVEPFGPVAIVNSFTRLSDAIAEANRLPYGLGAYAYTGSLQTMNVLSRRIDAGMLTFNQNGLSFPEVTFGGVRDSGYGAEGGPEALHPYLVNRFVSIG